MPEPSEVPAVSDASGDPITDPIAALQGALREFAKARDWEQFHTPKNLVMALSAEVGELMELFQWKTPEESAAIGRSAKGNARVEEELADVFGYLLRLADVLDVDLCAALQRKIESNGRKYPAADFYGSARKYNE